MNNDRDHLNKHFTHTTNHDKFVFHGEILPGLWKYSQKKMNNIKSMNISVPTCRGASCVRCYPFTSSPASPRGLYCYNWQTTLIITLLSHTLNLSRPGKQHIFNQYHCNHGPIFIHYCETEWSMIWNYLIWYQSVIMTIYRWFRYISRSYGMILKIHPVPGRDVSLTGYR